MKKDIIKREIELTRKQYSDIVDSGIYNGDKITDEMHANMTFLVAKLGVMHNALASADYDNHRERMLGQIEGLTFSFRTLYMEDS